MPIQQLAAKLKADLNTIKAHVYTAGIAWAKCKEDVANLRPEIDVLTFEDYQRNVELFHCEMPTSMGYGAISQQFVLYPIGVRFRKEGVANVQSGAVAFISTDLGHGHQQVEGMERRLVFIYTYRKP